MARRCGSRYFPRFLPVDSRFGATGSSRKLSKSRGNLRPDAAKRENSPAFPGSKGIPTRKYCTAEGIEKGTQCLAAGDFEAGGRVRGAHLRERPLRPAAVSAGENAKLKLLQLHADEKAAV
jgi:hypothetical protein